MESHCTETANKDTIRSAWVHGARLLKGINGNGTWKRWQCTRQSHIKKMSSIFKKAYPNISNHIYQDSHLAGLMVITTNKPSSLLFLCLYCYSTFLNYILLPCSFNISLTIPFPPKAFLNLLYISYYMLWLPCCAFSISPFIQLSINMIYPPYLK